MGISEKKTRQAVRDDVVTIRHSIALVCTRINEIHQHIPADLSRYQPHLAAAHVYVCVELPYLIIMIMIVRPQPLSSLSFIFLHITMHRHTQSIYSLLVFLILSVLTIYMLWVAAAAAFPLAIQPLCSLIS
jgi:hypothetical protein